jgi:WD40 repeat protein
MKDQHPGKVTSRPASPAYDRATLLGLFFASAALLPGGCSKAEDLKTLTTAAPFIRAVVFSPDGHLLATASSEPAAVQVWSLPGGTLLQSLKHSQSDVSALAFSPDGRNLASIWEDLDLWDLSDGHKLKTLAGFESTVDSIAFSPDGKALATANRNGSLRVIDLASGKNVFTVKGHDEWISCIAYSPDGKTLAAASKDLTVRLWESATGRALGSIPTKGVPFSWIAFGPGGTLVMFKAMYGVAQVWDLAKQGPVKEYKVFPGHARVSADGRTLAVASAYSQEASVRDVQTGEEIAHLSWTSNVGGENVVGISADGTLVGVGSATGTVRLWRIRR